MLKHILTFWTICLISFGLAAQSTAKKILDHADFDIWKKIQQPQISNNGRWVVYELNPDVGDGKLIIYDGLTGKENTYDRSKNAKISADNRFVVFQIKPFEDTVKTQRRQKVKKENLPKDSLGILDLSTGKLTKIPQVQSFQLPEKWSGWLAYLKEPIQKTTETKADTVVSNQDKTALTPKKENKDNGATLIIRNLIEGKEDTIHYVKSYTASKEGHLFALHSTGNEVDLEPGIYVFDTKKQIFSTVFSAKGDYKQLLFDEKGTQLTFIADLDTTKAQVRPFDLYIWTASKNITTLLANDNSSFLPNDWHISQYATLEFSKDATKLFFGIAPSTLQQDTSLLEEEIVNVEVWAFDDPVLHTVQKARLEQEKKRAYTCVYYTTTQRIVQLSDTILNNLQLGNEGNSEYALSFNDKPYGVASTWEWWNKRDLYLIKMDNGERRQIGKGVEGLENFGNESGFSPKANFVFWFSEVDTAWMAYSTLNHTTLKLTNNNEVKFFDELDDHPDAPPSYGLAGWMKDDDGLLVYDRYDIWKIDPKGIAAPVRLTNGRSKKHQFRYIKIDKEKRYFEPTDKLLLSVFDEKTKESGYAWLDLSNNQVTLLLFGNFYYASPIKAQAADVWLFTRENFQVFPDLLYSTNLKTFKKVSNANPQQSRYTWGTVELFRWTSLEGVPLEGLLFKPENFDPNKKYPMLTYFYERNSDDLFRHRAPEPPRSSINFSFYTSRGYVVFVPDIPYKIGYPGESCYNAVIPGVTALIDKGFIDAQRIGVQGHSWGGYQIAYLLTRTNLFKCAESGAPVVNMFSAYGGIRWGSGLSRSGQYERTQSRIGGSIWDYPLRFLENSPLFAADKIQTPVLILHNDQDDAVPWYQGIEFYIAMRRLGNPAWLLNYNGEPHGIMKRQNRMDFNRRMQQFFDYYLQDAPQPVWMERGIPAIEKGIKQGFELMDKQ